MWTQQLPPNGESLEQWPRERSESEREAGRQPQQQLPKWVGGGGREKGREQRDGSTDVCFDRKQLILCIPSIPILSMMN